MDTSKDGAIAERYFGDSVGWLHGHGEQRWLLLRRDGLVLAAGQDWLLTFRRLAGLRTISFSYRSGEIS